MKCRCRYAFCVKEPIDIWVLLHLEKKSYAAGKIVLMNKKTPS